MHTFEILSRFNLELIEIILKFAKLVAQLLRVLVARHQCLFQFFLQLGNLKVELFNLILKFLNSFGLFSYLLLLLTIFQF